MKTYKMLCIMFKILILKMYIGFIISFIFAVSTVSIFWFFPQLLGLTAPIISFHIIFFTLFSFVKKFWINLPFNSLHWETRWKNDLLIQKHLCLFLSSTEIHTCSHETHYDSFHHSQKSWSQVYFQNECI